MIFKKNPVPDLLPRFDLICYLNWGAQSTFFIKLLPAESLFFQKQPFQGFEFDTPVSGYTTEHTISYVTCFFTVSRMSARPKMKFK